MQEQYLRRIQSVLGSRATAARGCRRIAVNFAVAGQLEEFRQASMEHVGWLVLSFICGLCGTQWDGVFQRPGAAASLPTLRWRAS